jgi:hypothetical protein
MYLDNQLKNFPFSYYCPQIIEEFKESLCKRFENLSVETETPVETNKETKPTTMTYEEIEKKIKTKYNLLLPAVYVEIKPGMSNIAFDKEDLRNVSIFKFFNFF